MIKSAISSGHHYYLVLFKTDNESLIEDFIADKRPDEFVRTIKFKESNSSIIQFQIGLTECLGTPSLLEPNKIKINDGTYLWLYDLYLGEVTFDSTTYVFLCYPYKSLQNHLFTRYSKMISKREFFVPELKIVLEYFENRGNKVQSIKADQTTLMEIIKYSAEIKDDTNADEMNIIGRNPISSTIYKYLIKAENLSSSPSSLKLRSWVEGAEELCFAFDKFGNFRFWIPLTKQNEALSMLYPSIKYFFEMQALKYSTNISKLTILENG